MTKVVVELDALVFGLCSVQTLRLGRAGATVAASAGLLLL